jgi:hypothetical protein
MWKGKGTSSRCSESRGEVGGDTGGEDIDMGERGEVGGGELASIIDSSAVKLQEERGKLSVTALTFFLRLCLVSLYLHVRMSL